MLSYMDKILMKKNCGKVKLILPED